MFPELGASTVVGIDASSKKVAWCIITAYDVEVGTTWLTSGRGRYSPGNTGMVLRTLPKLFDHVHLRDAHVYIEAALGSPRAGISAALPQAYVNGSIQSFFSYKRSIVELVYVQQWKKLIVGRGNASKDQVSASLRLRWPALHKQSQGDGDIIDAISIALYGVGKLCGEYLVEAAGEL
jgi:Holliday junction resolvasome RuvABC endonuclease subunit